MATRRATARAENVSETEAAAALILQREEEQQQQRRKRAKRRRRKRLQAERLAVQKMHKSVEVIKWCIAGICTVWIVSFIIGIVVLAKVHGRVAEIDQKVKNIEEVLAHPFANAAAFGGRQLDDKLREAGVLPKLKDDGK